MIWRISQNSPQLQELGELKSPCYSQVAEQPPSFCEDLRELHDESNTEESKYSRYQGYLGNLRGCFKELHLYQSHRQRAFGTRGSYASSLSEHWPLRALSQKGNGEV